jgi:hypothetical protein
VFMSLFIMSSIPTTAFCLRCMSMRARRSKINVVFARERCVLCTAPRETTLDCQGLCVVRLCIKNDAATLFTQALLSTSKAQTRRVGTHFAHSFQHAALAQKQTLHTLPAPSSRSL